MSLSILIPCFNEASRGDFSQRIDQVMEYLKDSGINDYEVIFINDGSVDDTKNIIDEKKLLYKPYIKCVSYKENVGKAYALKKGILVSEKKYILMMDADLSVPLEYIGKFYSKMRGNICLVGSRRLEKSKITIEQKSNRRFIGYLSRIYTRYILRINIMDTQCGFKMFPRRSARKIIPYIRSKRWLFDIELLIYLKAANIKLYEVPIVWGTDLVSILRSSEAIKSSVKEMIIIFFTKDISSYYIRRSIHGGNK